MYSSTAKQPTNLFSNYYVFSVNNKDKINRKNGNKQKKLCNCITHFFYIYAAQQGVTKFWESFGYISPNWRDPPSTNDMKYVRKRAMTVQSSLQCDLCLKWRILPYSSNNVGKAFPDDWVCSMNPDSSHNRWVLSLVAVSASFSHKFRFFILMTVFIMFDKN